MNKCGFQHLHISGYCKRKLARMWEERRLIGNDIMTAEFGWPVGMPLCRSMGGGLFKVRTNLPDKKIARVQFCAHKGEMVLLHDIIKKTQKTPKADLDLAKKRMRGLT